MAGLHNDNRSYHYITVSKDQEIDSNLLTSGLLTNELVVESLSTQTIIDGQYAIHQSNILENFGNLEHVDSSNDQDSKLSLSFHNVIPRKHKNQYIGEENNKQSIKSLSNSSFDKNNLPPLTPIRNGKFRSSTSSISSSNENSIQDEKYIVHNSEPHFSNNVLCDLPHKKRISSKMENEISLSKDENSISQVFACQICGNETNSQLDFFAHLKSHYEPPSPRTKFEYDEKTSYIHDETIQTEEYENSELMQDSEAVVTTLEVIEVKEEKIPRNEIDELECENIGLENEIGDSDADEEIWLEEELTKISNEGADHLFTRTNSQIEDNNDMTEIKADKNDVQEDFIEESSGVKTKRKTKRSVKKSKHDVDSDPGTTLFPCTDCEKIFKSKHALYYHRRTHTGVRSHVCETCGKGFFNSSALKVHSRLHSGDKPYQCEFCGRAFRQWGDRIYHITSIHSDEKKFQCEFCGKDFARRYSLSVHRRIHTGERNYVCDFCNKAFRASSYLRNHRRIHTGEKNHECPTCKRKFRVRSDMKRHMNTHKHDRTRKIKSKLPEKDEDHLTDSSDESKFQQQMEQIEIYTENNTKEETKEILQRLPKHANVLVPPNVVVQFDQDLNIKHETDQFKQEVISQNDSSFVWNYVPSQD